VADALTFFLAAVAVWRVRERAPSRAPASSVWPVLRNRRFLLASIAQALLSLSTVVLTLTLPLWIISRSVAPAWVIGTLLAGSTVLAVSLQVPMSKFAVTPAGATRSSWTAGLLLAAGCSAFAFTDGASVPWAIALLTVGAVLRLLGELLQAASGWTMSFSAPPAGRASTYQAIYSTAFTAAAAIGPLLSGWVVTQPQGRGWFGAAAFFACAGVVAAASGAAVMRYRPRTRGPTRK